MNAPQIIRDSAANLANSVTRYRTVSFPGNADFTPSATFKAIHVQTGGTVIIVGVDGAAVTMTLAAGYYPFAGKAINYGTAATGITAMF